MAYIYPDMPSKASIKRALTEGVEFTCRDNTPRGQITVYNTNAIAVEGPHYPKPHRWYGTAVIKEGFVTRIL